MNLASVDQQRILSGPEKVAALLLALDRDVAQKLLKHFDQNELRNIAKIAAGLGAVAAPMIDQLIIDLIDSLSADKIDLVGSANQAEELLTGVIPPDQIADIMSEVLGSSNQYFWQKLSSVPDATLAAYIANEHPQTIAVIFSKIETAFAARLLTQIDARKRKEVVRRMLMSKPVSDAALRILETTLQEDVLSAAPKTSANEASQRIAGIINQMDRDQMEDILQSIADTEPAMAETLKSMLFTFEDLPNLSAQARMILFDQVSTEQLIMALRGSDSTIRGCVLPCLSARTRRMVEAELASSDSPPKREVARAQRAVAEAVLRLAEAGTIEIGPGSESAAA